MPRIDPATRNNRQQPLVIPTGSTTDSNTRPSKPLFHSVNGVAQVFSKKQLLPSTFYKRVVWTNALRTQTIVVRNATGSIACAWVANACYSQGNIFSGKPSVDQSRRELIVANSVWATITFCVVMLIARVPLMLPLRFVDAPDRRPSVVLCLKKLVRGTIFYFIVTMTVMFVCSYSVGFFTAIHPEIFKYKLDCYAGTMSTHGFFTGITLAAKRIFYRETCQGRDRLNQAERNPSRAARTETRSAALVSFRAAYRMKSFKFWRAYVQEFPKSSPAALAGVFVHVLSQQRIMDRGAGAVTSFVVASIVFKLFIQESTKHYIIKKKIRSVRFMCAAVALPTVLIDTQTRIIISGTKNTKFAVLGTIGMAFAEICLRVMKAHSVLRVIRKRETQIAQHRRSVVVTLQQQQLASNVDTPSPTPMRVEFEMWLRQLHAYHIAEINADTYAEYIAIGCSASILFFFGDHPYYSLLRQSDNEERLSQRLTQLKMLAFQVGIEVLVDFVSTVLEMMAGIEFDMNKSLGAYLTVLFMVTAVLNINISMGIYLY